MNLIEINDETILPIVLYGSQNEPIIRECHKKVMVDYLHIPMNYIECPFPAVSHGSVMNYIIKNTIDSLKPDYYLFIDSDCIFLKKEVLNMMYDCVKYKNGIWSPVIQYNHKKNKITNSKIHAFAGGFCLCFRTQLYNILNRPDLDHWSEGSDEFGGDTCEKLSIEAKKRGYMLSLIYPSHSIELTSDLDNLYRYGRGNTYGDNLIYHQMDRPHPLSKQEFVNKCKEVLEGEYDKN